MAPMLIELLMDHDDHISTRMLKLHEQIGQQYEHAAEPVVEEQLAKAGARLAAVNSVWP